LVFVLLVAALVARDADGPPGIRIFDQLQTVGGRRHAVGVCVSLAAALCIAQIAPPGPPLRAAIAGQMGVETRAVVLTTMIFAPFLWLVACAVIIVSYARRPALSRRGDQGSAREVPPEAAASTSGASEVITEFSPQRRS
jgi:H+/gluconate symporter-like permease